MYGSGLDALGTIGRNATASQGGARAGQEGFGVFVTPGQIDAKARELDAAFQSMHTAILSYVPTPERAADWKQWLDTWAAFRATWEAFTAQLKNDALTRMAGSTAEMLLHYQERLAAWQNDFHKWGGKTPGPPITKPGRGDVWRTIGIGVAVSVATGLVFWGLRKVLP